MAKEGSDSKGRYVIVEPGDTLSQICKTYLGDGSKTKYTAIAKLNGISNPNLIIDGQKIYLTGTTNSSSSKETKPTNKAYINYFGLLSKSDSPTLYAGWTNPKPTKETDHFKYRWEYTIADTGAGNTTNYKSGKRWLASEGQTTEWECTCAIPDNAEIVYFEVKPVSKTYTKKEGDKDVTKTYWTCDWTNMNGDGAYKPFNVSKSVPPKKPSSAPSIERDENDRYKLTITHNSLDPEDLGGTQVEFQVIKNNHSIYATSSKLKLNDTTHYATYNLWNADAGAEYKARCRIYNGSLAGEWSDYSGSEATPPNKPAGFTKDGCYAVESSTTGKITVYLKWKAVDAAVSYDIEYTTDQSNFDYSDQTKIINGITTTQRQLDSLDPGFTYYFRLRAVNKEGDESAWSEISYTTIGKEPAQPTTWSSSTSATVGGPLSLYWVHNSKDGSSQTWATVSVELYVASKDAEGNTQYTKKWSGEKDIKNSTDFDEKDKTSSLNLTKYLQEAPGALQWYKDGVQVRWRVRTAGITNSFGEWSVVRIVDIYANPTVSITLRDATNTINTTFDTIGSFPIYISATTSPATQAPIGFFLSIASNDVYETVDSAGNDKMVNAGEEVYTRYFDQNGDLDEFALTAGDVDLETNVNYTLTITAAMDSGLSAESSVDFTVSWVDVTYTPNATIVYDSEKVVTQIRPFCELYTTTYKGVTYDKSHNLYSSTGEAVSVVEGSPLVRMYAKSGEEVFSNDVDETYYYVDASGEKVVIDESHISRRENVFTTAGEQVYLGYTEITIHPDGTVTGGEDVLYHEVETGTLVEGVTLAVYRREFDGSYTELGSSIDNTRNTYIVDPHPALDYARYRIVATTDTTGAISYYDVPGFPIGEKAIIIQWAEDWSYFDADVDDPPAQPPWSGSMLKLLYNVDVSDSYDMDVALIEYTGRKRPVSYYGTQLGESSTWSTVIPKDDEETLYALRRLAIWTGDAYVREPSGTGYWANVSVSFQQTHGSVTIPVTLTIKRVEGGA